MRILFFTILVALAGSSRFAKAQQHYVFREGLAVEAASSYGREALYTDQLAYRLYTHTLQRPVAGAPFGTNNRGQTVGWKAVSADTAARFTTRGSGFGTGGYLYLRYTAPATRAALLHIQGNSAVFFNGVLHAGDPYASGWLYLPVMVQKGLNELYVRGLSVTAELVFPAQLVLLLTADATLPHIRTGSDNTALQGAVVVANTTAQPLVGWQLKAMLGGRPVVTTLPVVPAFATRKVAFGFNGSMVSHKGNYDCTLSLLNRQQTMDEKKIGIEAVDANESYTCTFTSAIDGSLQYYAVTPQQPVQQTGSALFLSIHGAGVEAIGQARAYQPKNWGTVVAATNRRPRGFNWEDWGRLDALEVLGIAKATFRPHPQQVYLTGHSMGGHGTWFLGAAYPGLWAGIAPCSGYPTLKEYGSADGKIPDTSRSPVIQMLLRASNQSDVLQLAGNYQPLGIYVLHGDSDRVVSVNYARQMKKTLAAFHTDFSYYEYPGGEHWFGNQSVDWPPLFDFFKWHRLSADSSTSTINFSTANPGISAGSHWAFILQQQHPLQYSTIRLQRNLQKKTIKGTTANVRTLKLLLDDFAAQDTLRILLDSLHPLLYVTTTSKDSLLLGLDSSGWHLQAPAGVQAKGPQRYGTFKEAFNRRMLFVYGTAGTPEENAWSRNKAQYDAETWYYRGNGAVDLLEDKAYSPERYPGRNVILYGNASTNTAWKLLLADAPIQVSRNNIRVGQRSWTGDQYGSYFIWPMKDGLGSTGVVTGSGIKGMQAAAANQYFAGGSGFPDYMVFSLDMLQAGAKEVKLAGFFNNEWQLAGEEAVQSE